MYFGPIRKLLGIGKKYRDRDSCESVELTHTLSNFGKPLPFTFQHGLWISLTKKSLHCTTYYVVHFLKNTIEIPTSHQ